MPEPETTPAAVHRSSLPPTPPPEWEFHTWYPNPGRGGVLAPGQHHRGAQVRRRVTYGPWEPVHPDHWADEPPTDTTDADQHASAISIARDRLVSRGLTAVEAVAILLPILADAYREVAEDAAEGAGGELWGTTAEEALTAYAAAWQRRAAECDLIVPEPPTTSLRDQIADLFRIQDGQIPAWAKADAGPGAHVEAVMAVIHPALEAERDRTHQQIDRKIQIAGQWANALTDLQAERTRTRELLTDLTDPDPCWYDHHGYCQAHTWMTTEPACPHARAKTLITPPAADQTQPREPE